jgi:hypothetical protein
MPGTPGCPNCRRLQGELDSVNERLGALEAKLRRGKRQATPFGRDAKKPDPKRPGRKPGKGVFSRRKRPPEDEIKRTERAPLARCPECGTKVADKRTHETIQTDIPIPKPVHTRFVTESGYCPCCRKRVRSRHPEQVSTATGAAGVVVGPNAKAVAADMHHRLGVPYEKVAEHFSASFGFEVTSSALCQSEARLAEKMKPVYDELVRAIRDCCAVHADETGWRIGMLSAWLWVFTSRHVTVYVIDESRGHEVVVEILGREFKGVLVADCFLAYDHRALAEWIQQKCFAHFLKTLAEMEAEKTRGAVRFPREVAAVLRRALALRDEKAEISALAFTRRLGKIERELDRLVDEKRRFTDPDNRRFAKRLRKQRRHLFTFLKYDGVDATNNRAERMLRPAVVVRKTGGCNKTERGARTHSVLASVLVTARDRGVSAVDYIGRALTAPNEPPSLLAAAFDSS